jgi:hypothetical protein
VGLREHIRSTELDRPIVFATPGAAIEARLRDVTVHDLDGAFDDLRIDVEVEPSVWATIDRAHLFALEPDLRGPGAASFAPEGTVRLELRLAPEGRRLLALGSGAAPATVADRLLGDLVDAALWRASAVTVPLVGPDGEAGGTAQVGFRTAWDRDESAMAAVARAVIDEQGWTYQELTDPPGFGWRMGNDHGEWETFLLTLADEPRVAVYSQLDLVVPPERTGEAALLVARINQGLPIGTWELDVDDGSLRCKTSLDPAGEPVPASILHRLVDHNLVLVDRYLEAFVGFVEGRFDARGAVELAEG